MLKPTEREALSHWWRDTGRHIAGGLTTGLAIVGLPLAFLLGLTVN